LAVEYPQIGVGFAGSCVAYVEYLVCDLLWFVGDSGPEWVVVAEARYPAGEALPAANFADIRRAFTARGFKGHSRLDSARRQPAGNVCWR
jgi:hypothetical protein